MSHLLRRSVSLSCVADHAEALARRAHARAQRAGDLLSRLYSVADETIASPRTRACRGRVMVTLYDRVLAWSARCSALRAYAARLREIDQRYYGAGNIPCADTLRSMLPTVARSIRELL